MLYSFYRIGLFVSLNFPIRVSYGLANTIADIYHFISAGDRRSVRENISRVLGLPPGSKEVRKVSRDVFRDFAKYLIDFFRFGKVDKDFIENNIKLEGVGYIDEARAMGKGVIMLSAHIGNWELGGIVVSMLGYPISGVVLTHKDRRINDFFKSQRLMGNMKPIEMGSLKSCYKALRGNELLALLGDRDFTKNGVLVDFFGKQAMMPKGPATFSYRLGSPIVPCFLVREPDDTYRFIFGKPMICDPALGEEPAVRDLTAKCSKVIESCVKKYPEQWFVFRNIWKIDDEDMRPDTII